MKSKKLFLFLFLLFSYCLVEDDSIKMLDAYSELSKAIEYKYKECGNKPQNPLIPPTKIDRNSLRICTLSILRMECPFNEYPIFCYDMFFDIILK